MTKALQLSRFKLLDTAVKRNLVEAAAALEEIRDEELYIAGGHKSFKEYAESLGKNYHWAWRQISAGNTARSLPAPEKVPNVATAKAISKVPPPKRVEVIKTAEKATGGKLSAPAIQRASKAPPRPAPKPKAPTDGTGLPIPPEVQAFWDRNEEANHLLTTVSRLRVTLEKAQESKDLLFRFVDYTGCISKLKSIYEELQCAKSFAVCPECNGVIFKDCPQCRGRGTLPEFWWNMVDEKIRKLRE